jgi:hypothetical protein
MTHAPQGNATDVAAITMLQSGECVVNFAGGSIMGLAFIQPPGCASCISPNFSSEPGAPHQDRRHIPNNAINSSKMPLFPSPLWS